MASGTRMAQCSLAFLKRTACLLATPLFNTLHVTRRRGKVNTAMRRTVPIYNTIEHCTHLQHYRLICRQSHKSLVTDSRAFAGTLLDSDHRLLIAQLDLSRLYYVWSEIAQPPSAKHAATTPNSWPVDYYPYKVNGPPNDLMQRPGNQRSRYTDVNRSALTSSRTVLLASLPVTTLRPGGRTAVTGQCPILAVIS